MREGRGQLRRTRRAAPRRSACNPGCLRSPWPLPLAPDLQDAEHLQGDLDGGAVLAVVPHIVHQPRHLAVGCREGRAAGRRAARPAGVHAIGRSVGQVGWAGRLGRARDTGDRGSRRQPIGHALHLFGAAWCSCHLSAAPHLPTHLRFEPPALVCTPATAVCQGPSNRHGWSVPPRLPPCSGYPSLHHHGVLLRPTPTRTHPTPAPTLTRSSLLPL